MINALDRLIAATTNQELQTLIAMAFGISVEEESTLQELTPQMVSIRRDALLSKAERLRTTEYEPEPECDDQPITGVYWNEDRGRWRVTYNQKTLGAFSREQLPLANALRRAAECAESDEQLAALKIEYRQKSKT